MSKELAKNPEIPLAMRAKVEQLALNLFEAKKKRKEVNKELKAYKITSEKLEELKKARRQYNEQIKEEKERIEGEFQKDETYNGLREEKESSEETIANSKLELKILLTGEAKNSGSVKYEVDVHGQKLQIYAQLSLDLFLDGKQE